MPQKKNAPVSYLDKIGSPEDLRALPVSAMPDLAHEIRTFLIDRVQQSGGHLASNLGVVELTLAIHRVFQTPQDHLIWDVGHQSYVHKILTGRRDRFDTLRQVGGLSGFTRRSESIYDPFGAGHSSTSLSAALGFAEADLLAGRDRYTIAVMGDGAFTGGLVHEALNNCRPDLPLILILNENEMSISPNRGAFAQYIARVRASRSYLATKRFTIAFLHRLPLIGPPLYRGMRALHRQMRRRIAQRNYFEELGFLYLGPVDGNSYSRVEHVLRQAKARHGAVIVHVQTQKGKGYAPAENDPKRFHSMAPPATTGATSSFHAVFGQELTAMAQDDPRLCAITAAMGLGCGLEDFCRAHPQRFFDVGIAEGHAATFAAGLAANGMLPCFAVYSTFLQRAYDNVLHDIALQGLPVKLFIDRAGLSPADGATHHGIFDVSYLSAIPGIHMYAPVTYGSLRAAMHAAIEAPGPVAVRYANAAEAEEVVARFYPDGDFQCRGVRADLLPGAAPQTLILTYGMIVRQAMQAADAARAKGRDVGILLLEQLSPYPDTAARLVPYMDGVKRLVFVEEGIENGGAAMLTLLALRRALGERMPQDVHILAIRDHFAAPDRPVDLYHYCGIAAEDILHAVLGAPE